MFGFSFVNGREVLKSFDPIGPERGRSTLALEKILLFCYHYDPKAGAYVWFALNIMRGGGVELGGGEGRVIADGLLLRFRERQPRLRGEHAGGGE